MADGHPRAGGETANVIGDRLDGVDAIVNEEHLAASIDLARDTFLDEPIIPRLHEGEDWGPVAWRRLNQRHVAEARE